MSKITTTTCKCDTCGYESGNADDFDFDTSFTSIEGEHCLSVYVRPMRENEDVCRKCAEKALRGIVTKMDAAQKKEEQ
jgi:hypothetical protein